MTIFPSTLLPLLAATTVMVHSCDAFQPNVHHRRQASLIDASPMSKSTSLNMISFGGLGGSAKNEALPRDVKDAVSRCRQAVQDALQQKTSRMDIEFPVGTKFGVEKQVKKKRGDNETPTQMDFDRSDRELARLFVDMFQPLGGENICVVFNDEGSSDAAKKRWKGDASASSKIMAMNRGGNKKIQKKKKSARPKGFAAKMAAEIDDVGPNRSGPFKLPDNTELALFVAPGPKELVAIDKICSEVGMGTLVVLLNARLSKVENFGTEAAEKLFTEEFEPVFSLAAAPQQVAPDCLLFRAYPGDWVLARKPKVGQPKELLTQGTKPTLEECEAVYASLDPSELDSAVENALENVAGWFR